MAMASKNKTIGYVLTGGALLGTVLIVYQLSATANETFADWLRRMFNRGIVVTPPTTTPPVIPPVIIPPITPPNIPAQSTSYQLERVSFDCDDIGITSLGSWVVGVGIYPLPAAMINNWVNIHILVKDPAGVEKAHFIKAASLTRDTSYEHKTFYMQDDTIRNLEPGTLYTAFCWITNFDGVISESYFPLKTRQFETRGVSLIPLVAGDPLGINTQLANL